MLKLMSYVFALEHAENLQMLRHSPCLMALTLSGSHCGHCRSSLPAPMETPSGTVMAERRGLRADACSSETPVRLSSVAAFSGVTPPPGITDRRPADSETSRAIRAAP